MANKDKSSSQKYNTSFFEALNPEPQQSRNTIFTFNPHLAMGQGIRP
jgi:hypothetical protein